MKLAGESETRIMRRFTRTILPKKEPLFHSNEDHVVTSILLEYSQPKYKQEVEDWLKHVNDVGFGYKYDPAQIVTAVERFQAEHAPDGSWRKTWKQAQSLVAKQFNPFNKKFKLTVPTTVQQLKSLIPYDSSYPGYSYYLTGKRRKGELFATENDFHRWVNYGDELANGKPIRPADPCLRIQNGGLIDELSGVVTDEVKFKNRLVLADDADTLAYDVLFHRSIVEEAFRCNRFYATGKTTSEISAYILRERERHAFGTNFDFSHYDQSICGWQMRECFKLIKSWIDFQGDSRLEAIYDSIADGYICKSIVWGKESCLVTDGMFSGKYLTNYIDSMIQLWMVYSYHISKGYSSRDYVIFSCGDDGYEFSNFDLDLTDMASYLEHNFGVIMNPEKCLKQTTREAPYFLKRRWRSDGQWRDWRMVTAKMAHPEHYHDYKRRKDLDPYMMVWCAILTYPCAMKELLDVPRFKDEHPVSKQALIDAGLSNSVSGLVRYFARYVPRFTQELFIT